MVQIVCSSNKMKIYRNVLNSSYNQCKIHYTDLKSCIKHTWKNVKFVDIVIQNNQFNLQICCDELEKHKKPYIEINEQHTDCDMSFVRVSRELNQWHIGTFILDKINILANGYDEDIDTNKSIIIPLGIPISRINEFYGVRGL